MKNNTINKEEIEKFSKIKRMVNQGNLNHYINLIQLEFHMKI